MKDTWGRTVDTLRLSVTDRCNCRCGYCMPPEGTCPRGELLSLPELLAVARACAACGITRVRLTGGEPLLRPGIVELCREIAALPGIREVSITTNATLLAPLARPLRQAGVARLNLSLDTLRPRRYAALTRSGTLEQVGSGIRAAREAGFTSLKLNMVLIGGFNDDEIGDFLSLTLDHPWEVRFLELMPMGPCASWPAGCFLPCDTVVQRFPRLEPLDFQGVARRYRLPGARGTVGLIAPLSHPFCDSCRRLRVTADGMLKPCLHSRQEIPLGGLRGPELQEAIRTAVAAKPPGHTLGRQGSRTERTMNQIGG